MSAGAEDAAGAAAGGTWTVRRVVAWATDDFRRRGSTSPRLECELLLCEVLGCDRVKLVIDADRPLEPGELAAYRALHQRRRRGEPVAYLRGEREFYGLRFVVDRRVLVPRPETELLVEVGLRRTQALSLSARVLDLCTGSGCVAIALKKQRPTTLVVGSDVSREALEVARLNAERLGALVGWLESDLFAALTRCRGKLDLVTANPPYIAEPDVPGLPVDVRDFEPRLALVAGPDGLAFYRRLAAEAPAMLAPAGVLAVEVGAGQAGAVAGLFAAAGLGEVAIDKDYAGIERVVSARLATVEPGAAGG
ncbi:MAG: peptide chain release factor N(5)-glutamine methyltransferase [Polyangiaceae bacterium]|nr:peptide chain release factor N(5)-glutamine methyltransferase [Polyangiaceae bacterium]